MTENMFTEDKKTRRQEGKLFNVCDFSKFLQKPLNDNSLTSCPPDLRTAGKRAAFTLAEVLITLAVIGVVAAMTLPTLIQKQQKMAWTSQLKKTYSTLEQGFKLMMAEEGVDALMNVSFFSVLEEDDCYMPDSDTNNTGTCKPLFDGFKKYFKGNYGTWDRQICTLNDRGNCGDRSGDPLFTMPDGTQVEIDFYVPSIKDVAQCNQIKSLGGNMCSYLGDIYLDVNGRKGPNTYGRDIFWFVLSNDGRLYPYYGKDSALFIKQTSLDNNTSYWRKNTDLCGTPGGKADESYGDGCAARIMENNWVMDY